MPRTGQYEHVRHILQRRRRDLLSAHLGARRELDALQGQERDPEYEEGAQAELADYTLSSLLESQRTELRLIDAALARMDEGSYGECVDCGEAIPLERLEVLPFAIRCATDAALLERERGIGRSLPPTL